jgi:hypothetical protein
MTITSVSGGISISVSDIGQYRLIRDALIQYEQKYSNECIDSGISNLIAQMEEI